MIEEIDLQRELMKNISDIASLREDHSILSTFYDYVELKNQNSYTPEQAMRRLREDYQNKKR